MEFQASTPFHKQVPESGNTLHQLYIMVGSCPSLRCGCRKETSLIQRSRGFGHGVVVSKNCYSILIALSAVLCDCCKLSFSTSWFDVSRESIAAIPFEYSKHPLLTRSLRFLRAVAPSISSALWLHYAHPFVAAEEKRHVPCREAEGLVTELWCPIFFTSNTVMVSSFGLQDIDCALSCDMCPLQSNEQLGF